SHGVRAALTHSARAHNSGRIRLFRHRADEAGRDAHAASLANPVDRIRNHGAEHEQDDVESRTQPTPGADDRGLAASIADAARRCSRSTVNRLHEPRKSVARPKRGALQGIRCTCSTWRGAYET